MLTGRMRPIDVGLVAILLLLVVAVAVLLQLPEPTPPAVTEPLSTPAATTAPTPTSTPTTPPSPTPTVTPSPTPVPPTPTAPPPTPVQLVFTPRPTAPAGSTPTPLPLVAQTVPLPRSGLYIRRHNQRSSTVGAAPAAEGPEQIDVAPFALQDGVRLPRPQTDGGAFTLSFGLTEIPWEQKRDAAATHYLEVALRTRVDGDPTDQVAATAPSVAYVFVVDTSGSMSGAKLEGAKSAMRSLFTEMHQEDVLGIVDFDDQVSTVLPPTSLAQLQLSDLDAALAKLLPQGGTDLDLGLSTAISEVLSVGGDLGTVSQVVLFSDGNPTDRVVDWMQIRANVVTAIGGAAVRLSTFAFGADANARELDALAGVTGGSYDLVTDPAAVGQTLVSDLARRGRLLATDVRLNLDLRPDVQIRHLFGHDQVGQPISRAAVGETAGDTSAPSAGADGGLWIVVPDAAAGDAYWLVLEIAVPPGTDNLAIGQLRVTYVDTETGDPAEAVQALTTGTSATRLPADLVLQHAMAAWTSEVAYYALDDLREGDMVTASQRVGAHLAALEAGNADRPATWLSIEAGNLAPLGAAADELIDAPPASRQTRLRVEALATALGILARSRSGIWQP